jgi:hypothetical protein
MSDPKLETEIIPCPDCGGYGYSEIELDDGDILRFGCNTCNGFGAIQVKKTEAVKDE